MSKRIEIDGKFYRMRRGKLVLIPDEWLGTVTTDKTKRGRQPISRRTRKSKKKIDRK